MKSHRLSLTLAVTFCSLASSLTAQEKEQKAEGQIKLGAHKYQMEAGFIYEFEVAGDRFQPVAQISGGLLQSSFRKDPLKGGFSVSPTYRGVFVSNEKTERTLIVLPGVGYFGEKDTLKYTVTMKPMKLEEKALLTKEDVITATDPVLAGKEFGNQKTCFKSYQVTLKADQICVIEMTPKKKSAKGILFPRLLIMSGDKQLAQASSGSYPAVLLRRAPADGEYRILATGASPNLDVGEFTLTVRTVK